MIFKPIQPDEIVIGFSTAKSKTNIIAAAIRTFERTPYSHCYMRYFAPNMERDLVYQSNIDDVNLGNVAYFFKHNVIIEEYAFKITAEIKKRVLQKCIDRLH